jgi:hypothetical protein
MEKMYLLMIEEIKMYSPRNLRRIRKIENSNDKKMIRSGYENLRKQRLI